MTLNPGDIGFVQYNADNTDSFAFVALVDISAGEQILFTDNGWQDTNTFRTGEGVITWTAPVGGTTAGSVVTITGTNASSGSVTGTALDLSDEGDQILAYQGASNFIAAIQNNGAGAFQGTAIDVNTSGTPSGLTVGTNAIALNELDNARYTGPTTGNRTTLLAALNNNANWMGSDSANQTFSGGLTVNLPGSLSVSPGSTSVNEGDTGTTSVTFTVTRSGFLAEEITASYESFGGSATPGVDYTAVSGTLTFIPGAITQTFTVNINGDTTGEPDETLSVHVTGASGGAVVASPYGSVTIQNDDSSPSFAIAATNADRAEGNIGSTPLTFTVTRSGDISAAGTVGFEVTGNVDADDFGGTLPSGTLNFAANQSSQVITLNASGDTTFEADESFTVTLANASGAAIITIPRANGTIQNDDPRPISTPPPPPSPTPPPLLTVPTATTTPTSTPSASAISTVNSTASPALVPTSFAPLQVNGTNNNAPSQETVDLRNDRPIPLQIQGVTPQLTGTLPAGITPTDVFILESSTEMVLPGETLTIRVTVRDDLLPGDYSGTLEIATNDPNNPTITLPITTIVNLPPLQR